MARETYLTPEGLLRVERELEQLRTDGRREIAESLKRAFEMGTVDNAEYDEAKNEQARVEGRIRMLENLLRDAVVIQKTKKASDTVRVGSKVTVRKEKGGDDVFSIVGSEEADPLQKKISNASPIGKALLGKKKGQVAEVQSPGGTTKLTVVKIE